MLKFVEKFGYINKPVVCLQSQNETMTAEYGSLLKGQLYHKIRIVK